MSDEPIFSQSVLDRLATGIRRTEGCWIWQKGKNKKGYGWISVNGKCQYVHRVMMAVMLGRLLASNEVVMHECDNPSCCNPKHLILGDLWKNIADAIAKGRHNPRRKKKTRRLKVEEVLLIKLALKFGRQGVRPLAFRFGCGEQTIRDIRDNNSWQKVLLPEQEKPEYDPFTDTD